MGVSIRQNRIKLDVADKRYAYVTFKELASYDQRDVRSRYVYGHHLDAVTHNDYLYPVTVNGRLANARRYISNDRYHELLKLHEIRQVMES